MLLQEHQVHIGGTGYRTQQTDSGTPGTASVYCWRKKYVRTFIVLDQRRPCEVQSAVVGVQVVLMRLKVEVEEAANSTERYTTHINTVLEATLRNGHLLKVRQHGILVSFSFLVVFLMLNFFFLFFQLFW